MQQASRTQFRTGVLVLIAAAIVTGLSLFSGDGVAFFGWAILIGSLLVYRGGVDVGNARSGTPLRGTI